MDREIKDKTKNFITRKKNDSCTKKFKNQN